jgi:hypothetical protein
LLLSAAIAALIPWGHAFAQPNAASAVAERSPFLGEWELDLARMPDTYGPPPKRVTFSFEDVGSGKWRTRVAITAPDDSVRRVSVEYRRDGRAVQGEGDEIDGDSAAVHSLAPNVLVFSMAKENKLVGARTYAVSADGKEMTESAAGVDQTGAPFVRNFHFRRIR